MIDVAIVGAGPAGSSCAYKLAIEGISPTVFDHSHPREKPCGGLVSDFVEEIILPLKKHPLAHCERKVMTVVAPSSREIVLHFRNYRMLGFSRSNFDQYLLKLAMEEGASLIDEKVLSVERRHGWWDIHTTNRSYTAKTLVGADGLNSLVRRKIIGPLSKRDRGICFVKLVKGLEGENIIVKFMPSNKGYLWVVPRAENTSIGGGSSDTTRFYEVKNEVDAFIHRQYPQAKVISEQAALIPNIKNTGVLRIPIAGPNWILIGDAAGHVNPITGGGIIYALLDGEKAAEAISQKHPEIFNNLWYKAYGQSLLHATKLRGWIYKRMLLELYCMYMKAYSILPFR